MSFDPAIPQSGDKISQSQGQLLINMGQLNTIFDVDHVTYNNATAINRGKHDKSTYIEVSDPATALNELAVFSKESPNVPPQTELFYRRENSGTVGQLTIFKAWGVFTQIQPNPVVIVDSFNIASITAVGPATYDVTFTTNLLNANYGVLISRATNPDQSGFDVYTNLTVSGFRINLSSFSSTNTNGCTFLVIKN